MKLLKSLIKKNLIILFAEFFRSIFSLFKIIIQIIFSKILKKKTIFFFHTKKELTLIHTEYLEDFFYKKNNYKVFFGCQINTDKKNYYFIKPIYLNILFGIDLFISNNVSDQFTPFSKKIYIHHDVYDTPLVEKKKESVLRKRLSKYHFIVVASQEGKKLFENLLKNSKVKVVVYRYLKLDYLKKKINSKKINSIKNILIAPTNYKSFPNLTMQNQISKIIKILLKKNFFVIYRPHPSNLNDQKVQKVNNRFRSYKKFKFDKSNNYLRSFNNSDLMITDLSGTAYTFLLLTSKSVIFYSKNDEYLNRTYYRNLGFFQNRDTIGYKVNNIDKVLKIINQKSLYSKKIKKINNFKKIFFEQKKITLDYFLK